ncbi:MAG: T9SS type A sorting domain-containing protein, partial [Bacteroidales bacterium]|nr:T9SS type A sorting domain-containing protein [Bacteroidales bacterium]
SELAQNYPNPFSNETTIEYRLEYGAPVALEINDLSGRTVYVVNEGIKPAGNHSVVIRKTDLEAGFYYYTLKAGDFLQTKTMIVR